MAGTMQPQCLQHLSRLPRFHAGLPRTDSGLYVLLSGKRAYPHRGRILLPFFNNSNRSPENSVLCKPEVAGCSQTDKYCQRCSRRALLMSPALVQRDSQWHRTRHFQLCLLAKDTRGMAEGSVLCQPMFPRAPCYGIIHSQYEVTGYSHSMLSTECSFRGGEP